MDHISAGLRKLLFPGGRPVLLLVVLGAAALCLAFATRLGETPFAYIAYALSAYALTVSAVWFVTKAVPGLKRFLHGFALTHRYLTDNYFKVWASMLLSFFINLGFGSSGWPVPCGTSPFGTALWRFTISCCVRSGSICFAGFPPAPKIGTGS